MTSKRNIVEFEIAAHRYIKEKNYWLSNLSGELVKSTIGYDMKKTVKQTNGNQVTFRHTSDIFHKLIKLSNGIDELLHMALTAAVVLLLNKYTGSSDIIIVSPIYQQNPDVEYINTVLILRNRVESHMTYKDLLIQVKQTVNRAVEHQNYPMEILLEQLNLPVSAGEFPLCDVAVLLGNIHDKNYLQHIRLPLVFSFLKSSENSAIEGVLEYDASLYRRETIEQAANHFTRLLGTALSHLEMPISGIDILAEEEKKHLLVDFNKTKTAYPREKTIPQVFTEQVEKTPQHIALRFEHRSVTYKELDQRANQLANYMHFETKIRPNDGVGLLMERSIEMIISILGILKAGGAYMPIDTSFPGERITYMLKDSNVGVLLTTPKLQDKVKAEVEKGSGQPQGLSILYSPGSAPLTSTLTSTCQVSPANLAYIMYTSGSTGRPKGILTRHFNVIRVVKETNYIDLTARDRVLQLSNYAFDGSVFDIYGALLNGSLLVMLKRQDVYAVDRLSALVRREKITVFFVTTALFNTLVDIEITCFKGIRNVLFGGERVSMPHAVKALKYLGKGKITHVYGPTETTVYATYYFINAVEEGQLTIPIGKPLANTTAYILDKALRLVPIGGPGELFIGGDGAAAGYLNNPQLTAEKFISNPYASPITNDILYRSGDLCRWLASGDIEFSGRIDTQVKIRGFRIELQEIENHLRKHPGIKEAAVIAREDDHGDNYLCAYIVPHTPTAAAAKTPGAFSISELGNYLAVELPGFMIPAYFIELHRIPLTSNGKLDKKALPAPGIAAAGYHGPENHLQERLTRIWSEVLDIDKNRISIDANFFETGGHSLKATILTFKIHQELKVKVPLDRVFKTRTIRGLSQYIQGTGKETLIPIEPTEKKDCHDISPAQKRLYILHQMEAMYNMGAAWTVKGALEKQRLEETFAQLIRRHESLRTSFHMIAEKPVQRIHEQVELKIRYDDSQVTGAGDRRRWEAEKGSHHSSFIIHHSFILPFDLTRAPLMRVGLIKLAEENYILITDMHHIISDGISLGIFIKEFMAVYEGRTLPGLRLQYKDYCRWQKRESQKDVIKKQEDYWLKQYATEVPVLELPVDYPRPRFQDFAGRTLCFPLDREETKALNNFAVEKDVTLYMALLAAFNVLLAKLSGNEDIVVGTPVAGRRHPDLQPIIGMFVGTLAMRNYPAPHKTISQFIREVKECTLSALENQDHQFEDLVEKVVVNRDTGRNPLFDVMLAVQNIGIPGFHTGKLKVAPYDYENGAANFDLFLQVFAGQDILTFTLNYCTELFKEKTVLRFITYFKKIISYFIKNASQEISMIEIISPGEKSEILYDFNKTATEYPKDKTIRQLFEEQVKRTPDHIALVGVAPLSVLITYNQLNKASNQLAHLLRSRGVKPNTTVAVMMERSLDLVKGIWAVLKSGGTYLPIDPDYPTNRIRDMLEEAQAAFLLTTGPVMSRQEGLGTIPILREIIILDGPAERAALSKQPEENLQCENQPKDLIYIIFTSGSTGKPKGAGIYHRSFCHLVYWFVTEFRLTAADRDLLITSPSFDLTQKNIYAPLVKGGTLAIPTHNYFDPAEILREISGLQVTWINCTPGMMYRLVEWEEGSGLDKLAGLRYVFLGGEPISIPKMIDWIQSDFFKAEIVNTYGPTECTDISSFYRLTEPLRFLTEPVPTGRPIYNVQLYVLDSQMQPAATGVPGELFIGGEGLGYGYVNDKQLTAEKFLTLSPDPGNLPPKRIYRTGDLARWHGDGNIEFLGRIDQQVKIRGCRIELGEIEKQLLNHEEIKEAVVIARENPQKEKYLCAYIVANSPGTTYSPSLTVPGMREYLSGQLPDYMIPSYFIPMEKIPLTPNGKLDQKALPEPGSNDLHTGDDFVPPRTEMEKLIAGIWQELLGVDKVGIHDKFFNIGGNSLNIIQMNARLNRELKPGKPIPVVTLFQFTTISALADCLTREKKEEEEGVIEKPIDRAAKVTKSKDKRLEKIKKRRSYWK